MAKIDLDKLKKLRPEERIRKLRELEEERKRDLEETDKLIMQSISEIEEISKEPEQPEEQPLPNIFEEGGLEQQVAEEEPREEGEQQNVEYAINLYGELNEVAQSGSEYQIDRAVEIYEKIKATEYHGQDDTMKKIAEGSRRIMEDLMGEYRANLEYRP